MTLTRGARITGAVLCAVLAVIVGAWIGRDLTTAAEPLDLWRFWVGVGRSPDSTPLTTTLEDLVLFAVYVGAAVAALRSPVAAAALVATGVITLVVRLPGLWVLTAAWMDLRATDELRTRALYSAFAALGLGLGLIIAAVAGRRPSGASYDGYGARDAYAAEQTPTRPTRGVSILAFLLLGASAVVLAAWEVYSATEYGGRVYLDRITGSESIFQPLLGTPSGWLTAAIVVLGLVAATGALLRAVFSRPLGMVIAAFLVGSGARGLDIAVRNELFSRLGELPTRDQLLVGTWVFELAAGVVLVAALVRSGERDRVEEDVLSWQRSSGYGYPPRNDGFGPPPPASRPPGW